MNSERIFIILIPAILLFSVFIAYIPALDAGFVWDDDAVLNNPLLKDIRGLREIWTKPSRIPQGHYWPLVYTSFWIEYQLWNTHPFGYHFINILLHGINAILLFFLLRKLGLRCGWVAAFLFALHPVHVESVAWIMERKNVLSGMFFLLSILGFLEFEKTKSPRIYIVSLFLFIGSLLSKTSTVGLPIILVLFLWWKKKRLLGRDILPVLPFALAALFFALVDVLVVRSLGYSYPLGFIRRCLIASRAVCFYVQKLFYPVRLMPVYPRWIVSATDPLQYICVFVVISISIAFYILRSKVGKGSLVLWLFFLIMLAPVLGFVDFGYMGYSYVADHFQYLASMGIFALLSVLAGALIRKGTGSARLFLTGVLVFLLTVLGFLTASYSAKFENLETLFRYNLAMNPGAAVNYVNIGYGLYLKGRKNEAISYYKKALLKDPCFVDAYLNLGIVFLREQSYEKAAECLQKAVALNSRHEKARYNLARALIEMGEEEKAMAHLGTLVQENPENAAACSVLGTLLANRGNTDEAIRFLERALSIEPGLEDARFTLGVLMLHNNRTEIAAKHFLKLAGRYPDHEKAHAYLGSIFESQRNWEKAVYHYSEAIRINPDNVTAHNCLGVLYSLGGNLEQGEKHYNKAIAVDPRDPDLHYNLGLNFIGQGKNEKAKKALREALRLKPSWRRAENRLARLLLDQENAHPTQLEEALALAGKACDNPEQIEPEFLDTLAIAYAALGRYDEAIVASEKGLELARSREKNQLATEMEARLKQFKKARKKLKK